ncbi:hypothetical protein ALI22I_42115 [Saccharothrix sp. ALI-22-I]|uniref:hypothetical protein n=1 Tax=Saccharothrix sp. ALI-22-I TaxID=1933778 RepID=UPI00097BBC51|nr:hypothetical protein [Saccharothrix sp. ALI-22-I]ONI82632.1 hypothetical protein ALI22I_42115 [Saccharothrix sp. ALI-22-I]
MTKVLGLSHLQFEALPAAARESDDPFDLALVAMLGLLGLRISEAGRADVEDIGEEHEHRVLLVHGKGGKKPSFHCRPRSHGHWTGLSSTGGPQPCHGRCLRRSGPDPTDCRVTLVRRLPGER